MLGSSSRTPYAPQGVKGQDDEAIKTVFSCTTLYGCGTGFVTMKEERRLRVFENRVMRRIFCPRRDEVTGEWRRLHNEELYDLQSSPNITWVNKSRRMRWAGHVARTGNRRGVYRVLVEGPERRRPVGRPRRKWEKNIKMDIE